QELQNRIAEIDYQEAAGTLSKDDARKARAGARREAATKRATSEIDAIDQQLAGLQAAKSAAGTRLFDAEDAAQAAGAKRDELFARAGAFTGSAFFGVPASELSDPKKFEAILNLERRRISERQPRSERDAERI